MAKKRSGHIQMGTRLLLGKVKQYEVSWEVGENGNSAKN